MTILEFLLAWAVRSAVLVLTGAIVLLAARLKTPSIRLVLWSTILLGSMATPILTRSLPHFPLSINHDPTRHGDPPPSVGDQTPLPVASPISPAGKPARAIAFEWAPVALVLYAVGSLTLLLRLCIGLAMTLRLRGRALPTALSKEDIEIRESDEVSSPAVLGILRPSIVIPRDWREWNSAKLSAVVAHERSHIKRFDPALQCLSAIHRALLWFSPFSWLLHRNIVRTAEEASDDSAVTAMGDPAFYAEVLLDFMRRRVRSTPWAAVPMASYDRPDVRIRRILEGKFPHRSLTQTGMAAIVVIGLSTACMLAVATPQTSAPQAPTAPPHVSEPPGAPAPGTKPTSAVAVKPRNAANYLSALGSVTSLMAVRIRSRLGGLLKSMDFKEGELVTKGQLLARIESDENQSIQAVVMRIDAQILQDRQQMELAVKNGDTQGTADLRTKLTADNMEATRVASRKAQLMTMSEIRSPIAGLAGLRLIDPGNLIHPEDSIVVVTQIKPIAVVFSIPEDNLPQIRQRLGSGARLAVEAWNRDQSAKVATGQLLAIDNQIDINTGTAKLKAEFSNEDGMLFPNQFVNVRLAMR